MLCINNLPFVLVDSPSFKKCLKSPCQGRSSMARTHLKDLFEVVEEALKKELDGQRVHMDLSDPHSLPHCHSSLD